MILNKACPLCQFCCKAIGTGWNMSLEELASLRPIGCWLRNAVWAKGKLMRAILGTDWQPGHQDSQYANNTVRYCIATIELVSDEVGDIHEEVAGGPEGCEKVPTSEASRRHFYSDDNERLFQRRLVPDQVDTHAQSQTMLDITQLGAAHFRVVDVVESRLVELGVSCRFVALSYVWGSYAQSALVVNENNSFSVGDLPRTIRDAIHLTRLLGERYIWVDSICIDQSNPEDKHALVSCMNRIYESARLTIVAAGGNDTDVGLPGLSPDSRAAEIVTNIPANGDIVQLALGRPSLHALVENTCWNTRGWTYQEHVLSQCCLFFTSIRVHTMGHTVKMTMTNLDPSPAVASIETGSSDTLNSTSGERVTFWRLETGRHATNRSCRGATAGRDRQIQIIRPEAIPNVRIPR